MSAKTKTNKKISTNTHNNNNNKSPAGYRSILSPAHTNPSNNSDSSVLLLISTRFWTAGISFLADGEFFLRKLEQQRASKLRRPKFGFTPLIGPQTTKCKQGPLAWRPSGRHVCTRVYIPDWTKIHTHTYTWSG